MAAANGTLPAVAPACAPVAVGRKTQTRRHSSHCHQWRIHARASPDGKWKCAFFAGGTGRHSGSFEEVRDLGRDPRFHAYAIGQQQILFKPCA
ncbi:hypothetical protein P3342_008184 [Pyrenophora teres f. teres]|nr:hypothetical protein P3342_008184 [Pyrenophora teres f. teres]